MLHILWEDGCVETQTLKGNDMNQKHLIEAVAAQFLWIKNHGGDLAGYVRRYGSKADPHRCYGDGGEAIYAADMAQFDKLTRQLFSR